MKKIFLVLVLTTGALRAENPPPAEGFEWKNFPKECIEIQVPSGWKFRESSNGPVNVLVVCPSFDEKGNYDTAFMISTNVCHNPKDWKDGYFSALKCWTDETDAIKAAGKDAVTTATQKINSHGDIAIQTFTAEGDRYLPYAPHPKVKYHTQTVVRAFPTRGVVYVYSFCTLTTDWDVEWKIGEIMFNPFIFHLPDE